MRLPAFLSSLFALQVTRALANTEKVIFLAPDSITLPDSGPTLQALGLDTLSPETTILKTALPVQFPSTERPRGYQSWYLLQGLKAGQRYEVRVCWPAVVRLVFVISASMSSTRVYSLAISAREVEALLMKLTIPLATYGLLARNFQPYACV